MKKRVYALLLIAVLLLSCLPLTGQRAAAADTYVVGNNVTIPNSNIPADGSNPYCQCGKTVGSGSHWCCWNYGHNAYYYMWGEYPSYSATKTNFLRNVAAEDRLLTAENLKKYLSEAVPGALLRLDRASDPGASDNSGHTLIFVKMNDAGTGAILLEGNHDGRGRTRIIEWKFTSLVSVYSRYAYIKYIRWPDAPAYTDCAHTYDQLGICTACQAAFHWQATFDPASAGVYEVSAQPDICLRTDKPYEASTALSDPIGQGTILEVLGSVKDHNGNVWHKVSYGGVTGYAKAADLTWLAAGGYVDGYLSNGCERYPSYGYAITQKSCLAYSLPCENQEAEKYGYISQMLTDQVLNPGDLVEISGIIRNTQGQYWYQVTLPEGTRAYLNSSQCYTMIMANPYVLGSILPDNISGTTNLSGEIYAGGAQITGVQAVVHKRYHASGPVILSSGVDQTDTTTRYALYKSAVDIGLPFSKLANYGAGYYSIVIHAGITNYYLTADGQLQVFQGTVSVGTDNFTYLDPGPCSHVFEEKWSFDDNDHWQACTVCGTRDSTEGHLFVDGACQMCGMEDPYQAPLVAFSGMTMTLGNSLAANFVINTALLEGSGHYAVITKTYADGTQPVSVTVPRSDWKVYNADLYYFTFSGVNAKEMTDRFTVIVYNAAGKQVSVTYERTIEDYCYGLITKEEGSSAPDPERLALYTDILNYGAAAQDFFSYNLENLANGRLTQAQQAYATAQVEGENICDPGAGYMGSTLSLKNEILMNFVYRNATIDQAAYAVYTFRHHDGGQVSVTVPAEEFRPYGTTGKYIDVKGMKVADCGEVITVTLYDADGNILSTSTDSVWSYASRNLSKHEVYTAVLKLADSAWNFFH